MIDFQIDGLRPLIGMGCILFASFLASENKSAISGRNLLKGLLFQFLLALVLLKVSLFQNIFVFLNQGVLAVQGATRAGTSLVFGYLGGAPTPFEVTAPEHMFILGIQALPMILVFSALSAVLYYWQILP